MTEEVKNLMEELKTLSTKKRLSSVEKQSIASYYTKVLQRKFVKTSCNDCYRDACIEMYAHLAKTGTFEPYHEYQLKRGVLLRRGEFGSSDFVTRDNITDEIAGAIIKEKGEAVLDSFERYPSDWKTRVFPPKKAKTSKSTAEAENAQESANVSNK